MSARQVPTGSDRGGVWFDQDGQPHCPNCDQSLRHVDRTQGATKNGHHNSVYRCTHCDTPVISG